MNQFKAVHFGAGNIGRGLIGYLYQLNNINTTFIDVSQKLQEQLLQNQQYQINYLDTNEIVKITNFDFVLLSEKEKVIQLLENADFISTSIGSNNLKSLVPIFQLVNFKKKVKIICFENGFKISSYFQEILKINNDNLSFIDVSVDRIVINLSPTEQKLSTTVYCEKYFEIIADKNQGLNLSGINNVDNLDGYILRKLFFVNFLHAVIAFLGYNKHYQYIYQSVNDSDINLFVKKFAQKLVFILSKEYDCFDQKTLINYVENNLKRFGTNKIPDHNQRVIRNPILKLSANERFYLIYQLFNKYQLDKTELITIYFNILICENHDDLQAQEIHNWLLNKNFQKLREITNFQSDDWLILKEKLLNYVTNKR
ncbi:Mannitol-1-phosphate 5-dehydrogenase [[Mycoplasma] cavipharyngis]|uniref:mannitol-1-phosphate 5-dehydrogenase n=1 Tax=[Mycoplasma] cavipharyngis TaxID=92757 RepID=UPI003703FB27